MNPLLNNRFTYQEIGPELEINTLPSLTQEDEVLSISEMLSRHTRGIPLSGSGREPVYYPEEMGYVPDTERLDLTELHELAEHMAEQRKTLEQRIADKEKEEQEAEAARLEKYKKMEEFYDQSGQKPDKADSTEK